MGDNRCMQRVLTGAALGGAVGGAVGASYGTYEACAYKVWGQDVSWEKQSEQSREGSFLGGLGGMSLGGTHEWRRAGRRRKGTPPRTTRP